MYLCHLNLLVETDSAVIGAAVLCDSKVIHNCDTAYVICPPLRTVFGGGLCNSFFLYCDQRRMCPAYARPGTHFTL